ncbi:LOW QUALITY PROTEIN: hypothetical protein BRADI_1g19990v3 [Brachypodium distachyon]|uniref:Peroxidase n=1 Tax=Brachypodium distachyon TaxID=15368 RepID=A0A0Q3GWX6_BRADI|nr:LOW QUALITY PROTEIN: hypothetical protein BRADI_1g19990v3 [Brachypodium distachyon]
MAAGFKLAILAVACALLLATPACHCRPSELRVGYYEDTCPEAESLVRSAVTDAVTGNDDGIGIGAGLIRLLFHDCFVQGCDASVLLDPTTSNPAPEKLGAPNAHSLRGFEAIDTAKAALELACPGVVSCADVLAFAARDASYILSVGNYNEPIEFAMPGGRLDGRRSMAEDTLHGSLPSASANVTELVDAFQTKGLGVEDLVVLSGAHSARCSFFSDAGGGVGIDPAFARSVRRRCSTPEQAPAPSPAAAAAGENDEERMMSLDAVTPGALDGQYYRNVVRRRVVLGSDAALMASPETARIVRASVGRNGRWEKKFGEAMVRMAAIGVKTKLGAAGRRGRGEVRTNCRVVN